MKNVVTAAIIDYDNNIKDSVILLEKHVKCKGIYLMPCGKVEETDETFLDALKRELNEELGIDYSVLNRTPITFTSMMITHYDRIDGKHLFKEHLYYIMNQNLKFENKEPEKHTEIIRVPLKTVIDYCEKNGFDKYSLLTYFVCKDFKKG